MSKATLGGVYDFPQIGHGRFGVGAQLSLHRVPTEMEPAYGGDPGSWLVFLRWKLSATPH